ncbi:MAG: hypothetical protein KF716_18530 [Anaerolineae bacterium]|nr:hypothetical protein [Anaerolineae bacterium]
MNYKRFLIVAGLMLVGAWLVSHAASPTAVSSSPKSAIPVNPIVLENQKAGSDAWKSPNFDQYTQNYLQAEKLEHAAAQSNSTDLGGGNAAPTAAWEDTQDVKGYASKTSVNLGEQITFHVSSQAAQYHLTIYRTGWYNGNGATQVMSTVTLPGTDYGIPSPDPTTGLIEADWPVAYTLNVPTNWVSGIYLVWLQNVGSNKVSYITFVVRNDSQSADLLYMVATATWQAYNEWGGKSLYDYNSTDGRAYKVSYDRPYAQNDGSGQYFSGDYNMTRWLEKNGYNVTYVTSEDLHTNPNLMTNRKVLMSVFHDEYYSMEMFDHVKALRDAGKSLAYFTSNNIYWQIRYEPDSHAVDNRVIVCYKKESNNPVVTLDPWANDPDPAKQMRTTVLFRDPPVNKPENQILGVMFENAFGYGDYRVWTVQNADHWFYEGTGLNNNDTIDKLMGYEWDRIYNNGYTPSNMTIVSQTAFTFSGSNDEGVPAPGGTYTHQAVIWQAPSGAWVFNASVNYWQYFLEGNYIWPLDTRIQRITMNVLNHMVADASPVSTLTPSATYTPGPTQTPSSTFTPSVTPPPSATSTSTATLTATNAPGPTTSIFYRAINMGGPALVIDGNNWEDNTGTTPNFTTVGSAICNPWSNLTPATDANRASMIRCSRQHWAHNAVLTSVPNGTYEVYVYTWLDWADPNPPSYTFYVQGQAAQTYQSIPSGRWDRLGPWTANVTNGSLTIQTSGGIANLSGIEVYRVLASASSTPTATSTTLPTSTVPPTATATFTATATNTATATFTATITSTATNTATYTPTETATATHTATVTSTFTPSETDTATPLPTDTSTATFTPTDEPTSTPTDEPAPTFMPAMTDTPLPADTEVPTATETATPLPTDTATATFTATSTDTATVTPTETHTTTATETATLTFTPSATETATPLPTDTATATFTATSTDTATVTPTATETATLTFTPSETATATPLPTDTATITPTETHTATVTDTPTLTFTPSETATGTPLPTDTSTATFTATSTDTATVTPSETHTATATDTPTLTFTPSETATGTPLPTNTSTATFTATSTDTATVTPTETHTSTATETATLTFTPSETATGTPLPTDTSTATFTATSTDTATVTPTATHTATATETATLTFTPSATETATPLPTDTSTATFTATSTDTATVTPTETHTSTATDTPTLTFTPSETATGTPLPTDTATVTPTETHTATATDTPTLTFTATHTETATVTFTPSATETATPLPPTATDTATNTLPAIITATPLPTNTETATATNTVPPLITATPLPTNTPTFTTTATATHTATETATLTATATATHTSTPLPTLTGTATYTSTATNTSTLTRTSTATASPTTGSTSTPSATAAPVLAFYRAINIGGPALVIDGNNWEANSGTTTNFTTNGSVLCDPWVPLNPTTDTARAQMISCYREHWAFSMAMSNMTAGTYVVYVYVWQEWNNTAQEAYNIALEGTTVISNFNPGTVGGRWQRLGPWTVNLTDGTLNLTTSGAGLADISGLEVYRLTSGGGASATPQPSATFTPSRTNTPTITRTATATTAVTATRTSTASATNTPTRTVTPTSTPTLTVTTAQTSTATSTSLPSTATTTATLTSLPATATTVQTSTATLTSLPATVTTTATFTNTPLATATIAPTNTATSTSLPATATSTATRTNTPLPTVTSVLTSTATATTTATITVTRSTTPSPTRTPTSAGASLTPSRTMTPSRTSTLTRTPTRTPTPSNTPSGNPVFYRAYNLGGAAITIDGNAWIAGTSSDLATSGTSTLCAQTVTLTPATDANRATMIRCSLTGTAPDITVVNIPNGMYDVYIYVWEDNTAATYSISIQGGQAYVPNYNSGAAGSWQRLGPYTVNITGGWFSMDSFGGQANFSGLEFYSR